LLAQEPISKLVPELFYFYITSKHKERKNMRNVKVSSLSIIINYFLIIGCFVIGTKTSFAQIGMQKNLVVNCDIAQFRHTATLGYVELYFGFSPSQLTLHRSGAILKGGVNFTMQIKKNDSSNTAFNWRYYCPVQLVDTSNIMLDQMLISQRGYEMPFGSYRFEVTAIDSFNNSCSSHIVFKNIIINPFTGGSRVSDLELCSSIVSSQDTAHLFYKNTYNVIPNPTLVFGGKDLPVVFHYLETYDLNKDSVYTVETVVKDPAGTVIKQSAKQKQYGVRNAVEVGLTNITNLPSGKYQYQVNLLNGNKNEILTSKKTFFVNNPDVKTETSHVSVKSAEFLGLSDDELEKEFRFAKYLANDRDIKMFSVLSTTDARREFLANFWTSIENGQSGRTGLTRSIYMERVKAANRLYSTMGREGWHTDRGRVYLMYAEPSEVQRYPSTDEAKPYEVWNYDTLEGGVIFVFADRTGFGEYILIHSTKRGEIQDVNWQKKLTETYNK
jgi:GWxTD domain-containing protein